MYDLKKLLVYVLLLLILCVGCKKTQTDSNVVNNPLNWLILTPSDLASGAHHLKHYETFGKYVKNFNNGINAYILQGIDTVQSHALDGGGYFTGIHAVPTESPVYYNLKLFNKPLIEVPRHSSYCSGATYTAFIEALNMMYGTSSKALELSDERFETLRMQELDGGRREDHVKFWGHWNADGFGNHFALVQYSNMGEVIAPKEARPGDFVNISWESGLGHSVIFLGWTVVDNDKKIVYWSSQKATNGYGDQVVSLGNVKSIKVVRLTKPENLFNFDIQTEVSLEIPGDLVEW